MQASGRRSGERVFRGQIGFDLVGIGVIVRQGSVNLGEAEMPVLRRDLFGSEAHLVPGRDAHYGHARAGDLGTATAYRGIAIDQASDLDCTHHSSIIAKQWQELSFQQ
jgi:hypothetical protein